MLFRVICAVVVGTAFLIAIIAERRKYKEHRDKMQQFLMATISQKPFSVTEYLDRMERESLKLAYQSEEYLIVLWWGFDGLRLNEDGTAEWISRRNEPKPIFAWTPDGGGGGCGFEYSTARLLDGSVFTYETQCAIEDIDDAMQAQAQALQALQLQTLQTIQYGNVINSIRPAYQTYPMQYCIGQYTPTYGLTQTCCMGPRTFT